MVTPSELARYIGPPSSLHAPGGWEEYEDALGRMLPDDYKILMDTFGAGILNGMLMIGHPRSVELNLNEMLSIQSDHLSYLRSLEGERDWLPYPVVPESNSMHMWAYSDVGDLCFLVPKPARWDVGIWMREGAWKESDMGFGDWLLRELRGDQGPVNLLRHLRLEPVQYQPQP